MSSVNAGSSCPGRGRNYKGEKQTRRSWSPKEEAFLIECLKELVATSWRADNGFKQGYQQRLEEMIQKQFPGTDIRMSPHINSKLQIWKKQHGILSMMLARSGVGFNSNGKHMVECEDDQWDQIVKIEPSAKSMRYKSWPLLDHWDEIFGKDRATGDHAEDYADAANAKIFAEQDTEQTQTQQESDVHVDLTNEDEGENSGCNNSSKEAVSKPTKKGKKRKESDNITLVASVISEVGRSTSKRLDAIAQRIGYDFDADDERKDAYNSLKNVTGLTQKERFDVAMIFVEKYSSFLLFKGLPEEEKANYVQHLLGKQ